MFKFIYITAKKASTSVHVEEFTKGAQSDESNRIAQESLSKAAVSLHQEMDDLPELDESVVRAAKAKRERQRRIAAGEFVPLERNEDSIPVDVLKEFSSRGMERLSEMDGVLDEGSMDFAGNKISKPVFLPQVVLSESDESIDEDARWENELLKRSQVSTQTLPQAINKGLVTRTFESHNMDTISLEQVLKSLDDIVENMESACKANERDMQRMKWEGKQDDADEKVVRMLSCIA